MCVVLAITNSNDSKIKLIECNDDEDALNKMNIMYQNLCFAKRYDYNNTFFDREIVYAQVVNGLEQIEMRVGNLI